MIFAFDARFNAEPLRAHLSDLLLKKVLDRKTFTLEGKVVVMSGSRSQKVRIEARAICYVLAALKFTVANRAAFLFAPEKNCSFVKCSLRCFQFREKLL